jgi:hypothetical protein
MTDPAQHLPRPATPKQLDLLRQLCAERGVSFSPPRDTTAASSEIGRLLKIPRSLRGEHAQDRDAIRASFHARSGATAFREEEIGGYAAGL